MVVLNNNPNAGLRNMVFYRQDYLDEFNTCLLYTSCEQGYKPTLFYIKIGMDGAEYMDCSAEEDIELATATARKDVYKRQA